MKKSLQDLLREYPSVPSAMDVMHRSVERLPIGTGYVMMGDGVSRLAVPIRGLNQYSVVKLANGRGHAYKIGERRLPVLVRGSEA